MNKIIYTDFFVNRAKGFYKKFVSLKNDVAQLEKELLENPTIGESLGTGLYKVRLAVASKGGGKSGGFRVITYLIDESKENKNIYLVTIFDKSEDSTIQKKELLKLVKAIL